MTDYVDFFLNTPSAIVELELIEISHPAFTQTYYIARNAIDGVTVTLEDTTEQFFTYYPLRIAPSGTKDDLDYAVTINLGDLGEIIPLEFDALYVADAFNVKPTVKYRTYRSDDLTSPMFGPVTLEAANFSFDRDGCSFEARAPQLNNNMTGELYTVNRFPTLRGFL